MDASHPSQPSDSQGPSSTPPLPPIQPRLRQSVSRPRVAGLAAALHRRGQQQALPSNPSTSSPSHMLRRRHETFGRLRTADNGTRADDLGSTLDSIGDSSSDPDLSALTMSRAAPGLEHNLDAMAYEEETDHGALSQENYDADDTSVEDQDAALLMDPADLGLKEISNLAKFTVSSHKPGCGVAQLRSDDLKQFWQSDGPQPHKLTIYFVKRVGIREIRFHVDYNEDESYTPTKIVFKSGTSENNLIEFATMHLDGPVGWQQVPLNNAGGEPDGLTLVSWVLQMQILENHQNGKDTHLRGIKIYAHEGDTSAQDRISSALASQDFEIHEDVSTEARQPPGYFAHDDDLRDILDVSQGLAATRIDSNEPGFTIPDFMREPELR